MKRVKMEETSSDLGEGVVGVTKNSGPQDRPCCKLKGGGLSADTLMGGCHDEISYLDPIDGQKRISGRPTKNVRFCRLAFKTSW